jgi:hypothetical protein
MNCIALRRGLRQRSTVVTQRQLGAALSENVPCQTFLRQPDTAMQDPDHGSALRFEDQQLLVAEVHRTYSLRFPAHVNLLFVKCIHL